VSRLDALARADELQRRGGSDESVQIQRPIEDGVVIQVSPQRDVAWRQVPSVVLALDFLFRDQLNTDAIGLLLQYPQTVRIGQHHDAVQGVLKLGRKGLVCHSEELEQRLAAAPFIFRQGGEIEV
jgi:hypothetical protein